MFFIPPFVYLIGEFQTAETTKELVNFPMDVKREEKIMQKQKRGPGYQSLA